MSCSHIYIFAIVVPILFNCNFVSFATYYVLKVASSSIFEANIGIFGLIRALGFDVVLEDRMAVAKLQLRILQPLHHR
ncbi:MAG: hypothetical protein CK532_00360 [Flavobacteriales bacterium]|nr:MAG: hypothetical protein CK532_00360 [Flavobacteriales bacterium]